ncbi:hypothetical protein GCM10010836_28100 [Aminobacter aminovorans]
MDAVSERVFRHDVHIKPHCLVPTDCKSIAADRARADRFLQTSVALGDEASVVAAKY